MTLTKILPDVPKDGSQQQYKFLNLFTMSNLTECAFPAQENDVPKSSFSPGLNKHELATILIAAQMANRELHPDIIADKAYDLAKAVLGKFE